MAPCLSAAKPTATVVETPYGPTFAKLIGPEATVAHHKASYEAFLATMAP